MQELLTPTVVTHATYTNVIDVGGTPPPRPDRAEHAVKAFLARYRVATTRNTYGTGLRQWIEWCIENGVEPLEPTRTQVEFYARELEATGRSVSTVVHKLNILGMFFKVCVMDELVEKDPMLNVRRPTFERCSRSTLFTRGEVVDMLAAAERSGPQDHALISVLAHHGLRIGETLAIDTEHLVEQRGQMAAQIVRKGGNSQLIVFVPEVAYNLRKVTDMRTDGGKETLQANAAMQLAAFLDRAA